MRTPDQRARDKDRDAAIEIVEAAWVDGQIVEADRDRRVEELLRARTLAEIDLLTRDLQITASAPVAPAGAATVTPTESPYGVERKPADLAGLQRVVVASGPKVPRAVGVIVGVVMLAVVGVVAAGIVAVVRTVSGSSGEDVGVENPLPGQEPTKGVNVLSERGYRDLVRAVSEVNNGTEAFDAVLYPAYAVVYLPVDDSSQREARWYWDGEMQDLDSRGTSSNDRFDLAEVDVKVVVRLVRRVRGLVEDPTSWYAILRAPDEREVAIMAYASNEFSESAYLAATRDGRVVYRYVPTPG